MISAGSDIFVLRRIVTPVPVALCKRECGGGRVCRVQCLNSIVCLHIIYDSVEFRGGDPAVY